MTNVFAAAARFETSIDAVKAELGAIASEWQTLGIPTPVTDDMGEIHPDAVAELLARL